MLRVDALLKPLLAIRRRCRRRRRSHREAQPEVQCVLPSMLTNQPLEIIEKILSWVDQRQDLLSLALTTRLLRDLIIPHHIEFRRIRCHPHHNALWKTIIERPVCAENIRILELIDTHNDPEQIIPPCLMPIIVTTEDKLSGEFLDEHSAKLIARAIQGMVNLTHFTWFGYAPTGRHAQVVLDALAESGCSLQEFGYGHRLTPEFQPHLTLHKPIFSTLTSFAWAGRPMILHNPGAAFELLLSHTPHLENLHLQLRGHCSELGILQKGAWPLLRRVTIIATSFLVPYEFHMDTVAYSKFMGAFLSRHENLERVALYGNDLDPQHTFPCPFPKLQSLCFSIAPSEDILDTFPYANLPQLETLLGPLKDPHFPLLKSMAGLHTVSLHWSKDSLAEMRCMEQIRRLDLAQSFTQKDHEEMLDILDATVGHLLTLKNLTHLSGFLTHKLLQLSSTSQVVEPYLKRLAVLPNLKFVQVLQSDYTRVWIELIRRPTSGFGGKLKGNAKYAGYRIVPDSKGLTKSRFNMDGTGWGEFYNGLV